MFFELNDSKSGIIKSISIDLSKMDKDVCDHLLETLKKNIKIVDRKIIIKTNMTLSELKILNDGYSEFHSRFIDENIFSKSN